MSTVSGLPGFGVSLFGLREIVSFRAMAKSLEAWWSCVRSMTATASTKFGAKRGSTANSNGFAPVFNSTTLWPRIEAPSYVTKASAGALRQCRFTRAASPA